MFQLSGYFMLQKGIKGSEVWSLLNYELDNRTTNKQQTNY